MGLGLGQFRRFPMGRWIAAADPALCNPSVTQSRVGTHWSGAQYLRDALFKGRNIQELLVGDTSVGDTSTLHPKKYNITIFGQQNKMSWCGNLKVLTNEKRGRLKVVAIDRSLFKLFKQIGAGLIFKNGIPP